MSWTNDKERYQQIANEADPAVILVTKDSPLWFVLWLAGLVLTLGLLAIKMGWKTFRDEFATTIGPIQGYPRPWGSLSERLIVHEGRHTTQAVFFGWFVPVLGWFFGRTVRAFVGLIPMGAVYLLLPVPILGAFGRFYLELDADRASWKWMLKHGASSEHVLARAIRFGAKVCGGEYLWALIGGQRLFEKAAKRVIAKGES